MSRWVVAYDVSGDGRRARLAAVLSSWGDRVQKSVFECSLDNDELSEVLDRCVALIDEQTDAVHAWRQCATCGEARVNLGQAEAVRVEPFWIV